MKLSLTELIGKGYKDFWDSKHRYRVIKGSRGSKKSKTTALNLIIRLIEYPEANLLVVRRYGRTLKDSCFSELMWAINRLDIGQFFKSTLNPLEITYLPTGQKILFRGFDDAQKITSITVSKGVLCWVWIEEAYEVENESEFNKLDLSIRGEMPKGLFKQVTFTFNPWSETHWLKKRFFDTKQENTIALTTNYLMNEWLDSSDLHIFEEMKKNNPRRYKIEGLGDWGMSEGLIYDKVIIKDFDFRLALQLEGAKAIFGLDFGFTDPTAFVGAVYSPLDKVLFVFVEWYQTGTTNATIAKALKNLGIQKEQIVCDSAEPKSIEELNRLGINAKPAIKGPDSVRFGIQALQEQTMVIHPSCTNFIHEIKNYVWGKDRSGTPTDKPEHEFSHLMDALRYAFSAIVQKRALKFNVDNLR